MPSEAPSQTWQRCQQALFRDVRPTAVLISCLLTLINVASNPVLNDDAFGYLRAAEIFLAEGLGPVLRDYGWYGYSLLIAWLSQLLPLDLLGSARLLNLLCQVFLVYGFITLVSAYRRSASLPLFAAAVILVFPQVNEIRNFLVRDFGYWALATWALVQMLRYHQSQHWHHALGWYLSMLGAILFRLEGLLLLALMPLSLLFSPDLKGRQRLVLLGRLVLIAGLGLLLVYLLGLQAGVDLLSLAGFAYRYYLPGLLDLGNLLVDTGSALNQALFTPENFPGHGGHGLFLMLFAYLYTVVLTLVSALGWIFTLLLAHGFYRRRIQLGGATGAVLGTALVASLLGLLLFLLIMHFLTLRYATLAALILLSLAPLCLDSLAATWRASGRQGPFRAVLLLALLYLSVDSLVSFGHSKAFLREGGDWVRDNLPADAMLYSNDHTLAWRSGLIEAYDQIDRDPQPALAQLQPNDYLALRLRHNDEALRQQLAAREDLRLLASFANGRQEEARIYQRWR